MTAQPDINHQHSSNIIFPHSQVLACWDFLNFAQIPSSCGKICMTQNDLTDDFNWGARSRSICRSMPPEIMGRSSISTILPAFFTTDQAATQEIGKIPSVLLITSGLPSNIITIQDLAEI